MDNINDFLARDIDAPIPEYEDVEPILATVNSASVNPTSNTCNLVKLDTNNIAQKGSKSNMDNALKELLNGSITDSYKDAKDISNARKWCIEGLLYEGQISILAGAGGCGKSFLALKITHDLARGIAPLTIGGTTTQEAKSVLFITAEDDIAELGGRLKIVEKLNKEEIKKSSRIISLTDKKECYLVDNMGKRTNFYNTLHALIRRDSIDLLILDPLAVIGGLSDENNNVEANLFMQALKELISNTGNRLAIVLIHHTKKKDNNNKNASNADDIRGASGLVNGVRLAMNLTYIDNNLKSPNTPYSSIKITKSNSLTTQERKLQENAFYITTKGLEIRETPREENKDKDKEKELKEEIKRLNEKIEQDKPEQKKPIRAI